MMMQTDNFALFTKEVKIGITLSKRLHFIRDKRLLQISLKGWVLMTNINVRNYIDESYGLFINNEFQASDSGETLTVSNPANGEDLAKVARAGKKM